MWNVRVERVSPPSHVVGPGTQSGGLTQGFCSSLHFVWTISITYGVIGIFRRRTMALSSTKPLNRQVYPKYFLEVKAAGALGWQPYSIHLLIVLKSGNLTLLELSGTPQACTWIALPLPFTCWNIISDYTTTTSIQFFFSDSLFTNCPLIWHYACSPSYWQNR